MKDLLIVANWKSNKTKAETKDWVEQFSKGELPLENKEVIICPSFTILAKLNHLISDKNLTIKLGAQNISPFGKGAYTGEINGEQIKEFADFVIIGHSERRNYFDENQDVLNRKVIVALENSLTPIFCVSSAVQEIPKGIRIVAYEPIEAIGTGNPDTPENAGKVAREIKEKNPEVEKVLYGGSVTDENVSSFTKLDDIDGVLVGTSSLSASSFSQLIKNA